MRSMAVTSLLVLLALPFVDLSPASAQAGRGGPGVGIILGEPTGLSLKTSLRPRGALDAAVAWSFGGRGYLHLHGDFLFHKWSAAAREGQLGYTYGIGARAIVRDHDPRLGIRLPLGISYLVADTVLEFFGELAPLLDLTPNSEFGVNAGLGLRYWLN
jgi:hypothetical protein